MLVSIYQSTQLNIPEDLECEFSVCSLQEFFLNVKDVTRHASDGTEISFYQKWEEDELALNKKFSSTKDSVHASLCGKNECLHVSSQLKPYQFLFPRSLS
jgi:hypothetical protein